jgi:hypothetical protein
MYSQSTSLPPPPPLGGIDCVDYPLPLSCHLDSHLGTREPPMKVVVTSTSHRWEHTYGAHARSRKKCHGESTRMISGPINLVRENCHTCGKFWQCYEQNMPILFALIFFTFILPFLQEYKIHIHKHTVTTDTLLFLPTY